MIHIDLRDGGGRLLSIDWASLPRHARDLGRDPLIGVVVAALLLAFGATRALDGRLAARQSRVLTEIQAAAAAADSLGGALHDADRLRDRRTQLERRLAALDRLAPDRYAFVRLVAALGEAAPEHVWLDEIVSLPPHSANGRVAFRVAGFGPSSEQVTLLADRLRASGAVASVRLSGTWGVRIRGMPLIRFELTGETGGDGAALPGYADGNAALDQLVEEMTS